MRVRLQLSPAQMTSSTSRTLAPVNPPTDESTKTDRQAVSTSEEIQAILNQPPTHFTDAYVRTTHVVPAVKSRAVGSHPTPLAPKDRSEKKAWLNAHNKHIVLKRKAYDAGEIVEGAWETDVQMFSVVDRYASTHQRKGKPITLITIHGNGSPRRVSQSAIRVVSSVDETIYRFGSRH